MSEVYAVKVEPCIPPMGEEWDHRTTILLQRDKYEDALAALSPGNEVGRRIVDHLMFYGVQVPSARDWGALVWRLAQHIRHSMEGEPEQIWQAIEAVRPRLGYMVHAAVVTVPLPLAAR